MTKFAGMLDLVLCDTMENTFNEATGAWPEAYFILDRDGKCIFESRCMVKNVLGKLEEWMKDRDMM